MENTRTAFAGAIAGRYAIECDLQLTAEGEAVVFHDRTLDRMTVERGPVRAWTVKSLKAIAIKGTKDRIETLAELLDQVDGRVPLIIEIKSRFDGDDRLTLRALTILEHYDGPYCLMSFDPDVVEAIRQESPVTVRGIVADRTNDVEYRELPMRRRLEMRALSHLGRTDPHFVSFYWRELPWTPVTQFRNLGRPVISWTIRSPAAAAQALRYCDQVTFEGYRP